MAQGKNARTPTPASLAGRKAPSRRVTPVDYTLTASQQQTLRARLAGASPEDLAARRQQKADGAASPGGRASVGRASTDAHTSASAQHEPTPGGPSARLPQRRTVIPDRPLPAPPPGAVHSLNPDDARPFTRPLTIDEGLIRNVGVPDVTAEQIIRALADPDDSWSADAGTSDHFQRGQLTVQVRRADNAVIGAFATAYALAVRPEKYERSLDAAIEAAGPSTRGGRGTRHPTTRRELLQRLREAGFVIEHGSTHGRVSHPAHPGLFVPLASTPSDVRYTRHAVAQVRRVFGIDLRR